MPPKKTAEASAPGSESGSPKTRISELRRSDTFTSIFKRYGDNAIVLASEQKVSEHHTISSGVFSLDYALGGGWPVGRTCIVYGHKSTGKSTLMTLAAAEAQRTCGSCYARLPVGASSCPCGSYRDMSIVYIDVEGSYEVKWGRNLGCDPERLLIARPEYSEQALDIVEALIRSKECDLIIMDSIAFLTPTKEIEESVAKEQMGVQARLSSKAVRKFNSAMSAVHNSTGWKPTILLTNQVRMKIGMLFGNPETQPGGYAWGFFAAAEVRMSGGKYTMDEDSGRPLYVDLDFRVDKNKVGVAKMEGEFRMILSDMEHKSKGQIADEAFIVKQCDRLGLLTGGGSKWSLFGRDFRTKVAVEAALMSDPEFATEVRSKLMAVLLAA